MGFQDAGTFLAYFLTIGAMLLCVVYGVVNWNKPSPEEEAKEVTEELEWEQKDPDLKPGKDGK